MGWEVFHKDAQEALKQGAIKAIQFSGPTYQIEVVDQKQESYFPFLHLDENDQVSDHFCSCMSENGCLHQAIAYLALFDENKRAWHIRFQKGFFYRLTLLFFECSLKGIEQKKNRFFFSINGFSFELTAKTKEEIKILEEIFFSQPKETPENSIKFSNLTQEQIQKWKEGRAESSLRYELSFWSSFAKHLFFLQSKAITCNFIEENNEIPQRLEIQLPGLKMAISLPKEKLEFLLSFVDFPTIPPIIYSTTVAIGSIRFDRDKCQFFLEQTVSKETGGIKLKNWLYFPGKGFFSTTAEMLEQNEITQEQIPLFLERHHAIIEKYSDLKLNTKVHSLQYHLNMDMQGNLHIEAYLYSLGDLFKKGVLFFDGWIFLPEGHFIRFFQKRFSQLKQLIEHQEMSNFVVKNQTWLNQQKGFEVHLISKKERYFFEVDENKNLHFKQERNTKKRSFEFAKWIYVENEGFFPKTSPHSFFELRRFTAEEEVEEFVYSHREELETIPHFFLPHNPLDLRMLTCRITSPTSLIIEPFVQTKETQKLHFYGNLVYVDQRGFYCLPKAFSLPKQLQKKREVSQNQLEQFMKDHFLDLKEKLISSPLELKPCEKMQWQLDYFAKAKGQVKAKIFVITEHGKLPLAELVHAKKSGIKYLFSSAGLIDLQDARLGSLAELVHIPSEHDFFSFSTLQFLKLDLQEELLLPSVDHPMHDLIQSLLSSYRELKVEEKYDLQGLSSHLRLYQQRGLQWLWFLYLNGLSGLLCDDMGLGKTHQTMALMAAMKNHRPKEKLLFLVICPTSVIYHWQEKLACFLPNMKVYMHHGPTRKKKHSFSEGIYLTTYGTLRSDQKIFSEVLFDLAIFDEIQMAKNSQTGLHKALLTLSSKMVIGLTGTPIENQLLELKALFDIVLPGYLPKKSVFVEEFVNPIEKMMDQEKRLKLQALVKPFTLRRKKSEVLQELPEKTIDKAYCDLSLEQQELYERILQERRLALLQNLQDPEQSVPYLSIFTLLSHLKRICNHPALHLKDVEHYQKYSSGKWDLFEELLTEALESSQKVVVFSQYLQMLDIFKLYLKNKQIEFAEIRGSTQDRAEQIRFFQENSNCRIFLGSLKAAGVGIDLTAASMVILYDRWWNAAKEEQAIDRVHRFGQKRPVQVFKLITKNSIEEKIDLMIQKKGRLLEDIVATDDQALLKTFSREELIQLLL